MNRELDAKSGKSWVWLLPFLALAVGTAIGSVTGMQRYQEPLLRLAGHEATAQMGTPDIKDAQPRVNLPGPTTYDFGVMDRNEEQSHSFQVRNIGNGPLTLKVIDTTCKCTVGSIGNDTIAAGETEEVTLTWETRSYDREFRQSATIETNDKSQREIVFSVFGKVQQLALPDLPRMKFGRVTRSEGRDFETIVYGFRDKDLVITGHNFSNEEIASFFEVKTEPVPQSEWQNDDATSAIRVSIAILPGLPVGPNRQIIALETNKRDIAPMDVAIEISVVSDISVMGPGRIFDDERNMVTLGAVPQSTGRTVNLFLIAKGKFKDQVKFSVAEIDPEANLEVEFGEPADYAGGKSKRIPMKLIVKQDGPVVRRLGSKQGSLGRIVLNTNHPEIEQFELTVQFALQTQL